MRLYMFFTEVKPVKLKLAVLCEFYLVVVEFVIRILCVEWDENTVVIA